MVAQATAGPLTDDVTPVARAAVLRLLAPPGPRNPYPAYNLLRSYAPVYISEFGVCFVSRYAECRQVLGGPDFAVQDAAWFDQNTPGWRDHPATRTLYQGMQNRNPPDHGRLRRLLAGTFSVRRMAQLRDHVAEIADQYLDAMAGAGADGGTVDLIETLALPLPVAVISEMVGVEGPDQARFSVIARQFFNVIDLSVTEQERRLGGDAASEMRDYLLRAALDRRRHPRGDIASELAAAWDAGVINDEELLAVLVFLFSAGFATTAALIGNATVELLRQPALADALRVDQSLASVVVEESLRHEPPTQIDPRVTIRNTSLGGVELPQGQFVLVLLGAGNRDPRRFPDPDRFDITRPDRQVLSFGGGIHRCLGAPLARLEATVVLPMLVRRFPRIQLAGEPTRVPSLRMRDHAYVPVCLG